MTDDEFDFWEMVAKARESKKDRRIFLDALDSYWQEKRDISRTRIASRRKVLYDRVNLIKAVTPCADCDRTFPPEAMDFDHISDDKLLSISAMINGCMKWELIEAEMERCELVCAVCHRVRTRLRLKSGT